MLGGGDEGEKRKSPLTHNVRIAGYGDPLACSAEPEAEPKRLQSIALLQQRVISREAPASAVRAYPISPARGRSAEFPLRPSDPAGSKCFEPSLPAGKKKHFCEIGTFLKLLVHHDEPPAISDYNFI